MFHKRLIALIFTLLLTQNSFSTENRPLKIGERLRPVKMLGINVKDKELLSYLGKPLMINVWASWCGPCRAEMRSLEKLKLSDVNNTFNLIGISTDDYHNKAIALVEQSGITFDNYRDRNLVLEKMLGANRIPLTIFIDKDGKILKKTHGSMKWDHPQMIQMIEEVLELPMHTQN